MDGKKKSLTLLFVDEKTGGGEMEALSDLTLIVTFTII